MGAVGFCVLRAPPAIPSHLKMTPKTIARRGVRRPLAYLLSGASLQQWLDAGSRVVETGLVPWTVWVGEEWVGIEMPGDAGSSTSRQVKIALVKFRESLYNHRKRLQP